VGKGVAEDARIPPEPFRAVKPSSVLGRGDGESPLFSLKRGFELLGLRVPLLMAREPAGGGGGGEGDGASVARNQGSVLPLVDGPSQQGACTAFLGWSRGLPHPLLIAVVKLST
jgi:hypothetical protein